MGTSKAEVSAGQPPVYRETGERNDDAASSASATLLGDVDGSYDEDQNDDELPPAYNDPDAAPPPQFQQEGVDLWEYQPPPTPPFSNHDLDKAAYWTMFPNYSYDANALYNLITEQAACPPTYYVAIHGSHMERRVGTDRRDTVRDFLLRINLAPYIRRQDHTRHDVLQLLPINQRGYRGTRFPARSPAMREDVEALSSPEATLRAWCNHYVASRSPIKSFTFRRRVTNHDTSALRRVLRGLIQSTGYQGHVVTSFHLRHESITVFSPGIVNRLRTTPWVRYLFYFTFLWIVSWPILLLCTARYEVVDGVWEYADRMPGDGGEERARDRHCTVMSEGEWFKRWEFAIKSAAMGKMKCERDEFVTEEYRGHAQEVADQAHELNLLRNFMPRRGEGNAFSDQTLGLIEEGIRRAGIGRDSVGWGGDT